MPVIIDDEFKSIPSANKRWKLRNPEKKSESDKKRSKTWLLAHPKRGMLRNIKQRAKKKGWECTITEDDFEIPEYCPVLGVKLERNSSKGWWPWSPSMDRIDNTKGYVPGNVEVISWRANSLKSDATIEELEKVLDYMKKHKDKP